MINQFKPKQKPKQNTKQKRKQKHTIKDSPLFNILRFIIR